MKNLLIKSLKLLLLVTIFIFNQSCDLFKSNDPKPKTELEKLPPATQTGKNTFGCLVNGKAWVPKTSVDAYAVYQSGILTIAGEVENPNTQSISIVLEENGNIINVGEYPLNEPPYFEGKVFLSLECMYEGADVISGTIQITKFDKSNYIISGLFEFTTEKEFCEKLVIKNGRFDLRYIP
jgi:hypothetical protein